MLFYINHSETLLLFVWIFFGMNHREHCNENEKLEWSWAEPLNMHKELRITKSKKPSKLCKINRVQSKRAFK